MDKITIKGIAKLARIKVSEDELAGLSDDLTNIFDWIEQLNEVNTVNVSPMTSVIDMLMPSRIDEVNDGGDAERVLQNAPDRPNDGRNFYTVPKVIE
ncbi:MAG: Asp-tRNA(Asn)/Glu-tRNA(Gln) amidotransferase subunit GatC [Pseudomonadota bacterium]|nr:Asp-tRNA(Asn)/Glu-tRNA(Gln) amidotransferase subunit GatC [Pseudomonadota bacterium]